MNARPDTPFRNSLETPLHTALMDPLPNSLGDTSSSSPRTPQTPHPFAHSSGLLTIISPSSDLDSDEEAEQCEDTERLAPVPNRSPSPIPESHSIFSNDIRLDDYTGEGLTFAKDVRITGWTCVGDKKGAAYVVYDCVISLKEGGSDIHLLRRYSSFQDLYFRLDCVLPRPLMHQVPQLPPKTTLGKYRPTFLDRRRRQLQEWLSAVLLHPEIGGCSTLKRWVTDTSTPYT